jgi:hypothetical protein
LNTKDFFSQLPYALGPEGAMKFRLMARDKEDTDGNKDDVTWGIKGDKKGKKAADLRAKLAERLKKNAIHYDLEIQISKDPTSDFVRKGGSRFWDEKELPPIKVGVLTFHKQDVDAATGVGVRIQKALHDMAGSKAGGKAGAGGDIRKVHKRMFFHPVLTAKVHEPLGEVNAFRSHFYAHHAASRMQMTQKGVFSTPGDKAPLWVDFKYLQSAAVCGPQGELFGSPDVCGK